MTRPTNTPYPPAYRERDLRRWAWLLLLCSLLCVAGVMAIHRYRSGWHEARWPPHEHTTAPAAGRSLHPDL